MGLVEFAGWLATQVFDVVGSVAGAPGGDRDGAASAVVDLQVGKLVFNDVPAKMRTELWLSQLHRQGPKGGAPTAGEYYDLLFESLDPEVLAEIDKDTHRTFPSHPRLSTPAGQQAMLNVLRAYAASDPEIGYTQGMNFLAGLLLTYLPSEADAYAALALLMRQRGLREMYLPDMALLQIRLWQLSKLLPPRLAEHLEAHAVLPVLYASSWLLTCFAADLPLHFAARVMDVLMTGSQVASPMLKVAVGIVQRCEKALLGMSDFEEMVCYLRQEVPQWSKATLQDLLTEALSKPWSARQLRVLDQINGAETVMEAVARVNNLSAHPTSESAEATPTAAAAAAAAVGQAGAAEGEAALALECSASSSVSIGAEVALAAADQQQQQAAATPSQQQQQQQQQLTPRTVAKTLSSSFKLSKQPSPPSIGKAESVAWGAWEKTTELQTMGTQAVRIERSVVDLVDLDPQLSQALSCYALMQLAPQAAQQAAPASGRHAPAAAPAGSPQAGWQADFAAAPATTQQQQQQQPAAGSSPVCSPGSASQFAVPSPFASASPPSAGTPPAAAMGMPQSPPAYQQQQQQAQPAVPPSAAALPAAAAGAVAASRSASTVQSSAGSFQLLSLHSALPLVDQTPQQQQPKQQTPKQQAAAATEGSPASSSGNASPLHAFLNLFSRTSPGQGQEGKPEGTAAAAASGRIGGAGPGPGPASSSLLQEAPSSHGSSLAAVLQQLGLSGHPGSSGSGSDAITSSSAQAQGPAGAQQRQAQGRRLHHSSESEEFGSWKTAHGSEDGRLGSPLHSSLGTLAAGLGSGSRQLSQHPLASTASSKMQQPPAAQQQQQQQRAEPAQLGGLPRALSAAAGAAAAAGQQQGQVQVQGQQLAGPAAASHRATSLQEQHLLNFLSSAGSAQEEASPGKARPPSKP